MTIKSLEPRIRGMVTLFGLGYVPFSASIASLLALVIYYVLWTRAHHSLAIIIFIAVSAAILISATRHSDFVSADPRAAVSDEFLGMFACLLAYRGSSAAAMLIAFVLFRVLDILKPFPFNWLDRNVHGTYGFLVDDVAIGLVVGAALHTLHFLH